MYTRRPRRNRKNHAIRSLVCETHLHPSDLIQPFFVLEGRGKRHPVASMPGVDRLSTDLLIEEARTLWRRGVQGIILFPVIPEERKDPQGSEALHPEGLFATALREVKEALPDLCLIADLALDPFTSHGHDGLLSEAGEILNDETVAVLGEMSLLAAQAGADIVAPSDMMDGRVGHIRMELDRKGYSSVSILSYTAKYASSFYGPFRDALQSAPRQGDKKSYQMDPANAREAYIECDLDIEEGADMVMVKPALAYLDIIRRLRDHCDLPIAAYCVSGEYSMIMAASERGWLDGRKALWEAHTAIKRAGANMILTYACRELLDTLDQFRSS